MYLVQILLPLFDPQGRPVGREPVDRVKRELTERFGGVTAYLRAPAEGAWRDPEGEVEHDRVVILEVMADELDRGWWREYREELERRFEQEEVVVRALPFERM